MIKSYRLVIFVCLMAISFSAFAGGWPKKKGEGYFKLSEWVLTSNQHWDALGIIVPNDNQAIYSIYNTSIYAEFGITDRLTVIGALTPFSFASFTDSLTTTPVTIAGLGDSDLGVKYGLTNSNSPVAVSATLHFGLPLGSKKGTLETGDGEFNQYLQIDAGTGGALGKVDFYANIHAGFNNRTNNYSDEIRYGLELGAGFLSKKLWTAINLDFNQSLNNGDAPVNSTSLFSNQRAYSAITIKAAYYAYKGFGISVDLGGGLPTNIARNLFASPSIAVGIFWDMKK